MIVISTAMSRISIRSIGMDGIPGGFPRLAGNELDGLNR